MSKIDEMLKNERVEWKRLGEVCEILDSKRKPITKSQRISGDYPYYGANGIQDYVDGYIFDGTYILMGEDGSVINKDGTPVLHWVNNRKIWVNNHAHILGQSCNIYNLKYIYYYLSSYNVSEIVKGTPPKINQENMKKIEIPIPSLETQGKIVKILDKFTKYVTELQAELQAELQYRIKQYEYYRDMLLSEEYLIKTTKKLFIENNKTLRERTLGEIGKFENGFGMPKNIFDENGEIAAIHYGHIYTKYDIYVENPIIKVKREYAKKLKKVRNGDLVIARTSENVQDVMKTVAYLGEKEAVVGGHTAIFRHGENPKYLSYLFNGSFEFIKQKNKKARGVKVIEISVEDMKKIKVKLPSLELQNIIVEILDKFHDMVKNSEGLLPHEIALRQKQYEYYREKLLDFKK